MRLSSPDVTFARHVSVTSVEWYCVTLRALHGQMSLIWYEKWWFSYENNSNCRFEYVINRLWHGILVIAFSISSRPAKALGLIMESRVDTKGDNQNPMWYSRNATSEKWIKVFTRRHHARHNIIPQNGGQRNEQKYIKHGPFVFGLQLVTTCIYADFISFVIAWWRVLSRYLKFILETAWVMVKNLKIVHYLPQLFSDWSFWAKSNCIQ